MVQHQQYRYRNPLNRCDLGLHLWQHELFGMELHKSCRTFRRCALVRSVHKSSTSRRKGRKNRGLPDTTVQCGPQRFVYTRSVAPVSCGPGTQSADGLTTKLL